MTDILYPSHLNIPKNPMNSHEMARDNPYQAGGLPQNTLHAQPRPAYPMPQLPQSFQPSPRHDVDMQDMPPVITQTHENNMPEVEEKFLQDVTWPEPATSNFTPVNATAAMPSHADLASSNVSSAYPPMPPMMTTFTQPNAAPQAVDNEPSMTVNSAIIKGHEGLDGEIKGNFLSSMRERLASRPKEEAPKTLPKIVMEKATSEVVTDPKRPRSARSVFLTGALCGIVIAFVLMTTLAKITGQNEYAPIATATTAPASVVQVDKLNDDIVSTEVSSDFVVED